MSSRKKSKGFTITEAMIVVVIIAILASIAIPAYDSSVRKGRRADAQASLMGLANALERRFTESGSYCDAGTIGVGGCGGAGGDTGAPTIFPSISPATGTPFYNLTIDTMNAAGNIFILRATPINGQVGDGIIELDNTGARRWDENDNGVFTATELDWEIG